MPHRCQSPSNAAAAKPSGNGARGTPTKKGKRKHKQRSKEPPLFAFDTLKEEFNWGRPKRKIKTVNRFDPATKEIQCKIGHGFLCPQCSAICTYDSTKCYQCHLECIYEAGVGVVVLQDREISYMYAGPAKKKAKVEKKAVNTTRGKVGRPAKEKENSSDAMNARGGKASKRSTSSSSQNKDDRALDQNHGIQSNSSKDDGTTAKKKNIFANLKEKIKVATKSNSDDRQGGNDDDMADRVEEATQEWKESTIAESKDGAYTTDSSNPHISKDPPQSAADAVKNTEPPSIADDLKCCQELKHHLLALQLKYDSIMPNAIKTEEEFRDIVSKLEAAILQRNEDASAFSKTMTSCCSKIADIKKRAASLTTERDEFKKNVEAKGLSSVPKIVPNYSTRIDALQTKMSQMKTDCDAAKDRVKDLMSGNEFAKQEKERAAKELEEMEIKHGETFTQCYKEIESFKQQLSESTAKISTMATEKAVLVEKVTSTLIYVSKVRRSAETQSARISELESSVESLTAERDAAAKGNKEYIARLEAGKEEAVSKSKSLEETVIEMRGQIERLKFQLQEKMTPLAS